MSDSSKISRRMFFKRSLAATAMTGATAMALLQSQAQAAGKTPKAAMQYQDTPKNGEKCTTCALWVPPEGDAKMGACQVVAGEIDPNGWCVAYAAK